MALISSRDAIRSLRRRKACAVEYDVALGRLWAALVADGAGGRLYRVQVWFDRLAAVDGRQGELFARGGPDREKAQALSEAVDALNERYGRTVVGLMMCREPACQRTRPRSLAKLKLSVPAVSLSAKSICTVFFVAGAVSGDTSCPIRCSDLPNTSFRVQRLHVEIEANGDLEAGDACSP